MRAIPILHGFTALSLALMAGLFFAYSCSVVKGLGKLDDPGYLRAMQSINREIQNPWFFSCFFGVMALLAACLFAKSEMASFRNGQIAALLAYSIFVIGVTIFGNVPLNEQLGRFDISMATAAELAAQRVRFEGSWNVLNHLRTAGAIVSFLIFWFYGTAADR